MNVLMGMGNTLRQDDGVGVAIARAFSAPGWISLDCGTVPENFTSVIRGYQPETLVLVDAAAMGKKPGTFCRIPEDKVPEAGMATHQMPVSMLMGFLKNSAGQILLIGIEPEITGYGEELSPVVKAKIHQLIRIIADNRFENLPLF